MLWGCAYGTYAPSLDNSVMPVCRYVGNLTKTDYPNFYAWSLVLKVLTMHRLADVYGPVIYTKYGQQNADGSIDYDSQQEATTHSSRTLPKALPRLRNIITMVLEELCAILICSLTRAMYSKLWVKMANTLRLRLAIRISKANAAKAKTEGEAALAHPLEFADRCRG